MLNGNCVLFLGTKKVDEIQMVYPEGQVFALHQHVKKEKLFFLKLVSLT